MSARGWRRQLARDELEAHREGCYRRGRVDPEPGRCLDVEALLAVAQLGPLDSLSEEAGRGRHSA